MTSATDVLVEFPDGINAETLVNWYVQDFMDDISWEVFTEACHDSFMSDDKHYEGALVKAVVNQMVNVILKEQIEHEEKKFYLYD